MTRSWILRVDQEFVMVAESADEVLTVLERLEQRTHDGLVLINHHGQAAPSLTLDHETEKA